jgi:NAD(P)-dependent dehydrogenase (short-subunit alcohol dehydrogenase family)
MKLQGQVAIVTGGGHGIGRAIALRFANEGAALALCGTQKEPLDATAAEITAQGGRALAMITDVADESAVRAFVRATLDRFGTIDVLVNNAGIAGPTANVVDLKLADWERTLAINVTGAMLCAREALPHMIAKKSGRIINITSIAGLIGFALRSPYVASKWAMIGLTRTLALEAGAYGITVNAIAPGSVRGPRLTGVMEARAKQLGIAFEEMERHFVEPTALKKMAEEDEIAAMALFLASDEARSITGETLNVSNGARL